MPSFTVRRPTPSSSSGPDDGPFRIPALPRRITNARSPLAGSPRTRQDSDDDEETGIVFSNTSIANDTHHTESSDEDGLVPRTYPKKTKGPVSDAPLVIPAQSNPDWREAARRRRAACARVQPHSSRATPSFVPDSARATTGADGSVGGLGTRDTINSGPQLSGLQVAKKPKLSAPIESAPSDPSPPPTEPVKETEDQRALRALLAGDDASAPIIDIIPVPPLSEADALKQDVQGLPDVATADDYERVPISAFGAAMLRGMGWTDGAVAPKSDKRRKNGLTQLYLPQARPALLGIGAKEREVHDDGSGKKKPKGADMRYIPVARMESGSGSSRSGTVSRRHSRSPSRRDRESSTYNDDRERRKERDRDRDDESRRKPRDYDDRGRERRDYRDRDREGKGKQYSERDRTRERDRQDNR